MGIACFLVGCGGLFRDEEGGEEYSGQPKDAESQNFGLVLELVGVSFVSFSCNLGEASLLSLAGKFDSIILPKMASSSGSYWEISEEQTEDCPDNGMAESQENSVVLMKKGSDEIKSDCIT